MRWSQGWCVLIRLWCRSPIAAVSLYTSDNVALLLTKGSSIDRNLPMMTVQNQIRTTVTILPHHMQSTPAAEHFSSCRAVLVLGYICRIHSLQHCRRGCCCSFCCCCCSQKNKGTPRKHLPAATLCIGRQIFPHRTELFSRSYQRWNVDQLSSIDMFSCAS